MEELLSRIEEEIPRLRRYAVYLSRNRDHADDLVQECLTRAIARLDTWAPGTNLRAWLFVILRNGYISEIRRRGRQGSEVEFTDDEHHGGGMSEQEARLTFTELCGAFAALSQEHRDVLQLAVIEGMKYEEVAAVLKMPIGTVRSRLSRARLALRARLEAPPPADQPQDDDLRAAGRASAAGGGTPAPARQESRRPGRARPASGAPVHAGGDLAGAGCHCAEATARRGASKAPSARRVA